MKRRLLIIMLLLVGGAIVNVAVAWGCLVCANPSGSFGATFDSYSESTSLFARTRAGLPVRSVSVPYVAYGWRTFSYDRASPLPVGFVTNTVFYAVVLWLLFAGPFVLRRRRRIRRGLCPKCAYDLRGAGTRGGAGVACPECGSIVAS